MRSSLDASQFQLLKAFAYFLETLNGNYVIEPYYKDTQQEPTSFFFTLDAGLLARSWYSEGPATGYLDTGFSWFHCV